MTRTTITTFAALFGTAVLAAMSIGCGQSGNSVADNSGPAPAPAPTAIHPGGAAVDPATAASITGTIKLDGAPPEPKTINMNAVPACKKDRTEPATSEEVVPGDNGTLQNVVVYLQGDFTAYSFSIPQTPVTLDQKGCQYQPHVLALMTYQPLTVESLDRTTHNVHAISQSNPQWNQSQPVGGAPIHESFAHPEIAIPLKCNVHPWMKAYVAVLDNPYFAVTGQDGSFVIRSVPPGRYTLIAWQETYGAVQQEIDVAPNESKTVTLTFPAARS